MVLTISWPRDESKDSFYAALPTYSPSNTPSPTPYNRVRDKAPTLSPFNPRLAEGETTDER